MRSEGWQVVCVTAITVFVLVLSLVLCLSHHTRVCRVGNGEEVQLWLSKDWEVEIVANGGEGADLSARSEEDFLLVETFRSKVVPGGTVLEGLRAEGRYLADEARVDSGSTFLMDEGDALLTIVSEDELIVRVWPSFSPNASLGGVLALVIVVICGVFWVALFAIFRAVLAV